jgi:hypothetical protein
LFDPARVPDVVPVRLNDDRRTRALSFLKEQSDALMNVRSQIR